MKWFIAEDYFLIGFVGYNISTHKISEIILVIALAVDNDLNRFFQWHRPHYYSQTNPTRYEFTFHWQNKLAGVSSDPPDKSKTNNSRANFTDIQYCCIRTSNISASRLCEILGNNNFHPSQWFCAVWHLKKWGIPDSWVLLPLHCSGNLCKCLPADTE